ncbi:lamin tail domain-containing protein, partial [Candidatus Parcubacteria bacterium]|nr:lamin tail domain-containing protein [Candidatus Parcubacteria bacterium]
MTKQKGKIILILLFICAGFFCFWKNCRAASTGDVLINEIAWMGTEVSNNDEWIEFYNNTDQDINLENWGLYEAGGETLIEPLTGVIKGKFYYLVERTDDNTVPNIEASQPPTSWGGYGLNNNGEHLQLLDANLNIVDEVNCEERWFAGNKNTKQTMEKAIDGWQTSLNPDGTPKEQNSSGQETPPEEQIEEEPTSPQPPPSEEDGDKDEEDDEIQDVPIAQYKLGDVVINEFVSDPADEDVEWIELYNTTNKEINLDGWTIEEGSGAKTKLEGILAGSGEGKFMIIEKPKGNLNNKGDIIILRDNGDILIDQVAYGNWDDGNIENNAPVTGDPYSVARKFDGQNSFNNANDFAITTTLTKGASNIITKTEEEQELADEISAEEKARYDYSNDIIITEIFPNPAGSDSEDEFIELYNNSGRDVDLLGWRLGDESKKKYEFKYANDANLRQGTPIIKVGEYFVIYRSESKIVLNNGSDSVKLYQPLKDEPLQVVKYEKSIEGWSYNISDFRFKISDLRSDNYVWSEIVTPGATNEIKTINHPPVVDFDCPEEIMIGVPVLFDSSDTVDEDGDELKFSWDFGDSFTNKLANSEHTFFKQGAYTVKLTVSDGENEVEKEKIVKVIAPSPGPSPATSLRERGDSEEGWGEVVINEFLPNPEGADAEGEFIELYNQGSGDVNLINWKIDDSEGGSKPYSFDLDLWLNSGMYYVLDREESGLALNNTMDAVRLFDNFNELVEEIEYEQVVEGEAYARGKNNKWFWTTVITPGEENVISVADSSETGVIVKSASYSAGGKKTEQIIETTLDKINECEVGDLIKVVGIVAVEPGVLGSQYFYIVSEGAPEGETPTSRLQARLLKGEAGKKLASVDFIPDGAVQNKDNAPESLQGDSDEDSEDIDGTVHAAGIQVYNYKKDFPNLKVGDYIEVQGELSVSSGELRLKTKTVDDFKILEHREPPIASEAACEKVDEEYVGQLITVTGEIVERKSSIVYLDDGTDEVIVYLKKSTGINPKSIKEGEIVAVTGLVG